MVYGVNQRLQLLVTVNDLLEKPLIENPLVTPDQGMERVYD